MKIQRYNTIAVKPEVYNLIKARAKQQLRPISNQVEIDVRNQQKLDDL